MDELTYIGIPITKSTPAEDGTLIVSGKATGPDLDGDGQIADPKWLAAEMPKWFDTGANVREMHQPIAAGVGKTLTQDGDDWWLDSVVVDPLTVKKVEGGVLGAYSIGIKGGKVVKDAAAPGGRIVGGRIVEVSIVDRPCNPTTKLEILKADGADSLVAADDGETKTIDGDLKVCPTCDGTGKIRAGHVTCPECGGDGKIAKTETADDGKAAKYTQDEIDAMGKKGQAFKNPDGSYSYPVGDLEDVGKAVRAVGRGGADHDAIRKFIMKRAKALKAPADTIPPTWNADGSIDKIAQLKADLAAVLPDLDLVKADDGDGWTHDPAQLIQVRNGLAQLAQAELDELMAGECEIYDIECLLSALSSFMSWWSSEAFEGEDPNPYALQDVDLDMVETVDLVKVVVDLGASTSPAELGRAVLDALTKTETTEPTPPPEAGALTEDLVKTMIAAALEERDADLVQTRELLAETKGELSDTKAELQKLRSQPAVTAPAIGRPEAAAREASERDGLIAKVQRFEYEARTLTDQDRRAFALEQLNAAKAELAEFDAD